MPPEEFQKLIDELVTWSDLEPGRRSNLARHLGVSRQTVTNWLAGRRNPRLESWLKLRAFLKQQRRKANKKAPAGLPEEA
jgi:DNA-binding XRE family transcriptional regulator